MQTVVRLDRYVSAVVAALLLAASPASAAPLLTNGGFESGFSGWTVADQVGSGGSFTVQSGTSSPVNGDTVPAPPQGSNAALSDGDAPGTHVLYQDFFVPLDNGTSTLTFSLFIGNRADRFATPNSLDFFGTALNQQARVDILRGGTNPFSLGGADLLANLFRTNVGSPLVTGYNAFTVDLSGLLFANRGQTLRLRFAEVDNLAQFQLGVDNVNLDAVPAPEPTSMVLLGTGLAGLVARRRRARQ